MGTTEAHRSVLNKILHSCDLKVACLLCAKKENEVTYSPNTFHQNCKGDLLLARGKVNGRTWKHVSRRPEFPNPSKYDVCRFFVEGSGCTKHKNRCTFARSTEEATVWTIQKRHRIDNRTLIHLVSDTNRSSVRQTNVTEKILAEFGGEFHEICEACFHGSPQTIAVRRWNNSCASEAAHTWKPVLVHHLAEGQSKKVYNEIRPLPPNTKSNLQYCSHVQKGSPCWHGAARCRLAHSEVEMAVWKEESGGRWDRRELVLLCQTKQPPPPTAQVLDESLSNQVEIYCKACLLTSTSKESFIQHCASLEHARMISEDTMEWTHRPPPHNHKQGFLLCERPETCEYGERCIRAHSEAELQEWHMRCKEAQQIQRAVEAQGLTSYRDLLLLEYRGSGNVFHIMSEQVDDVTVTHDEDLTVGCEQTDCELKWNFQIKTERLLAHVALLKLEPGATFSLGEINHEDPCTYSTGERFKASNMSYEIPVSFKASNPGLYEQWLVFDFDMRPVLLRKLEVRVGEHTSIRLIEAEEDIRPLVQGLERWHQGNRFIIPCLDRREAEEQLLKEYKPPEINLEFNPGFAANTPITIHKYKDSMHNFLYREEEAQEKLVARLSRTETVDLSDKIFGPQFGMKIAQQGELFASVPVSSALTPDTPEGFILKRAVRSALVAVSSSAENQCQKVYETVILPDTSSENRMYLLLSKRCCTDLGLQNGMTCEMEVQFQLNRLPLCQMHKAIDLLPDVETVLPDLKKSCVPKHGPRLNEKLNEKQQAAISFILGDPSRTKTVAPLLIYGPFGTGKTFTMATAAKELVRQPGTRVLICTHTNSSADLYVKEHFHQYVHCGHPEAKPLRIKANKTGVPLTATDEITLQYCHNDGQSFTFPGRSTLDSHRVIITTATMAGDLQTLKLPVGYFTHILIDEASQMLECEALIPLGLAGKETRVILAGDHMQMGPKLFSVEEDQRSNHTLLNRLFHHYQGEKNSVALESRIIFNENYRSTLEIVNFVSSHFYGKSGAIKASGNVPPHPKHNPLRFCHVRGKCCWDTRTMSWYNPEEVACIVDTVQNLFDEWPSQWGNREQRMICVLSEGSQVVLIRKELRKRNLGRVTVENANNVQGKQFRAVVMSMVHTRDSLYSLETVCLEFFSDPRVMNTVMTRAQSQVIVVGDAAALCYFGKCSRIWKSYIEECVSRNSAEPKHLTMDDIEQEVREISRFLRPESKDLSDVDSVTSGGDVDVDEILQQLAHEYSAMNDEGTETDHSEGDRPNFGKEKRPYYSNAGEDTLLELVRTQPGLYKHGELVLEKYDMGYVTPFSNPTAHIRVKGRKNLGMSFSGDEVVVGKSTDDNGQAIWKVLGVTKNPETSRSFICTIEENERQNQEKKHDSDYISILMVPLNKLVTKIRILIRKKHRNKLPIYDLDNGNCKFVRYEPFNEESKRKHVYVVEVVCWNEHYYFPLGKVTEVLPLGTNLELGLKILDDEFELKHSPPSNVLTAADTRLDDRGREDFRNVITFTVDPENAKDLDDAISVKELGNQYEIGVHIADVASVIRKNSTLDKDARERGATYYLPKTAKKEPTYMFPKRLSEQQWSLLQGEDRRAVSLIVNVDKATHRIVESKFVLSLVKSDRQLSYEKAEDIISNNSGTGPNFDTLEGCVAVAYNFSRAHRKARLQGDWLYAQPDDRRTLGKRKSHQMIEELMIMLNNSVSEFLIGENETADCTPLRCQARPDFKDVEALKEKYKDVISMSTHLTYHIGNINQPSSGENFQVLTSLWSELQLAAERREVETIADFITTDDIHPQLHPATSEFRRLLEKAYIIRANSAPEAKVGHYSLQLDSYTKASSPIRSYLDLILQRLLHAALTHTPVPYSPQEIDILCEQVDKTSKKAAEYQKKAEAFCLAINLKKQTVPKLAYVTVVDPETDHFKLSFPFDKDTLSGFTPVLYRDLQLEDQPLFDKDKKHMMLMWKRRVYSINTSKTFVELQRLYCNNPCTDVPHEAWRDIVEALRMEKWETAMSIILSTETQKTNTKTSWKSGNVKLKNGGASGQEDSAGGLTQIEMEHYVKLPLKLKPGDILQVQMTTEIQQGLLMPTVQLLNINEKFEVCLNHAHSPVDCFARYAQHKTQMSYKDVQDYARIWKPLCEMESASTAVDDSESIVIEELELSWTEEREGSFLLSDSCIKDWAIECNLGKCYMCIRKRDLKQPAVDQSEEQVDPCSFTWVAHGVTTGYSETKKGVKSTKVSFYINHLPMDNIPVCVYQKNTKFTVELIPKLTPDVRKEIAVNSLKFSNDLVKKIVLGHRIPGGDSECLIPKRKIMRRAPPKGLPALNESQYTAVEEALKNKFTLIQGPPGTGKTVVGAYIVYWFLELNSLKPRHHEDPKDQNKKEVILYCGPSNKSVDVVAEYLMKFGDTLKPLRVYSRQMEISEYPYPGSILQLSRKSLRQERSKPELRSITMHHRLREPENPYSEQIREFDERIRLANESQGEQLTSTEVKEYKKLLNDARLHELKKHDVILCTCTAASTPNLTKSVSARQILIDECAMATEPQALVPLVSFKPEKIVLLGDHKQLRPIVNCMFARNLGLSKSLFERYMDRAVMLDTQYRMHEDICEFPSNESYDGRLKTGVHRYKSVLMTSNKNSHIVFGHVTGLEVSLMVTTEKGNENSKANREESEIAVHIAVSLVREAKIRPEEIAILSPYNAQVSEIRNLVKKKNVTGITVTTITKSQGSEWRYVILSTVRSCPTAEIEVDPSRGWLSKNVGFVGDPNQINVGITRAQEGLCIIGNQELLNCSTAWKHLLSHYRSRNCVTMATDITVRKM